MKNSCTLACFLQKYKALIEMSIVKSGQIHMSFGEEKVDTSSLCFKCGSMLIMLYCVQAKV